MTKHLQSAAALIALCLLGFPTDAAEYDAEFVAVTMPEKLSAQDVFPVAISMRNAGTATWAGPAFRLRSIDPKDNLAWGTGYILIAQGTSVKPGEEYTFRSHLRAPAEPGKVGFRWQVCKDGTEWFGEATPARSIDVLPRPADAGPAGRTAARTSDGKRVLAFDDFEYFGSFKAPRTVGDARGAFSESGLALRPMPDGSDRLLMNYTHPTQVLFEVEVPELIKVQHGGHADLKTAEVKRVWGPISVARQGDVAIHPNGGFVWIEDTRTLVWTWYHGYKTGDPPPVLGATTLSDDGRMTTRGPWYLAAPGGLYKSYWGGVVRLPQAFADRYTGGKRLALGFGGYYSICGPASRGPALGAIPDPDPSQTRLSVTPLLYHPHDSPAPRDGNYFNANCGFWSEQPAGPDRGTWTYDDWCRAGAFVDTAAGHAYVAFVRLGTGRLGYDYGKITSADESQYWYFYDPKELGEAAAGRKEPWQIAPSSTARVAYPLGRMVTGACFDARTGRLFLCVNWAYPEGLESYPAVHVYRVREHQ